MPTPTQDNPPRVVSDDDRAPLAAWVVLLAIVAAIGIALLVVAYTVGGEHAKGNWVGPARLIGALLSIGGAGGVAALLTTARSRPPQRR